MSSSSSIHSPSTVSAEAVGRSVTAAQMKDDAIDVVNAMVVDSDDVGDDDVDDDAIVTVVEESPPTPSKEMPSTPDGNSSIPPPTLSSLTASTSTSTSTTNNKTQQQQQQQQRRQPNNPAIKTVRLPPMSSPGLLIPPGVSGPFRAMADSTTGLATPNSIFQHAMSMAGYTTESRVNQPHRGSSVQRQVGDMFDSNVKFSLHFPSLVPDDLLSTSPPTTTSESASASTSPTTTNDDSTSLPHRLIRAFQSKTPQPPMNKSPTHRPKAKRKLPGFNEMAPLSLTIPYPEEYIRKRLKYVEQVKEREQAIVEFQEEELALDLEKERREMAGEVVPDDFGIPSTVVPPIPEPPTPPRLQDIPGLDPEQYEDQYPLYLPKGANQQKHHPQHHHPQQQQNLVGHLDKSCFHIVEGRYFGAMTNSIADPHVIGPNAPGLAGMNLSGGTGLATSNAGGAGSSGGVTLLAAPAQYGASVNANVHNKGKDTATKGKDTSSNLSTNKGNPGDDDGDDDDKTSKSNIKSTPQKTPPSPGMETLSSASKPAKSTSTPKGQTLTTHANTTTTSTTANNNKKKKNGPPVTSSASELRRIVEEGGEMAEQMKTCIMRAAVHASRCGNHTRNFRAPNGAVYPDISKAFAAHAGFKPCERCKNNKQGAYHCRLRRKHKELDYDGTETFQKLTPLYSIPSEELLLKAKKKKKKVKIHITNPNSKKQSNVTTTTTTNETSSSSGDNATLSHNTLPLAVGVSKDSPTSEDAMVEDMEITT